MGAGPFGPPGASAAEPAPGTACATGIPDGSFMRTGGAETGGVINFLVCQGGTWVSVLEADAATGTITASKITGLSAPTGTSDAVNKAYVDTAAAAGGSSGGGTCYYIQSTAPCGQGFSQMPGTVGDFDGTGTNNVCCSSGFFADDTVPNTYDIADAEIGPNDLYISAIHQVAGITEASITVGGDGSPQYRLCNDSACTNVAAGWSASERTINESQYYQVRNTSSASSPGTHTASLVIGDATATWNLTTPAGPDPFSFGLKGIGPSDDLDSDIVHITGVYSAQVSVSGQGSPRYRICADSGCSSVRQPWGSAASLIDNGEYLQARATASSTAGQQLTANITVGDTTETWDFIAGDPSFTGTFDFAACAPGGECTSNEITVNDPFGSLGLPYDVSGPGSPILVVNGTAESNSGTFDHGDSVAIRATASSTPGDTITLTLESVFATATWDLQSADPGFTGTFNDAGCTLGETCTSNTITVNDPYSTTNIPYEVTGDGSPILVVNGTPESNTGTFDHGDTVAIRMTASGSYGDTYTATVTSVGASASWDVEIMEASCKAYLDAGASTGNGVYRIDPDGGGGTAPFDVYCDMTTDGGGWTLISWNQSGTNPGSPYPGVDYCSGLNCARGSGVPYPQINSLFDVSTMFGRGQGGVSSTFSNLGNYTYAAKYVYGASFSNINVVPSGTTVSCSTSGALTGTVYSIKNAVLNSSTIYLSTNLAYTNNQTYTNGGSGWWGNGFGTQACDGSGQSPGTWTGNSDSQYGPGEYPGTGGLSVWVR